MEFNRDATKKSRLGDGCVMLRVCGSRCQGCEKLDSCLGFRDLAVKSSGFRAFRGLGFTCRD